METGVVTIQEPLSTKTNVGDGPAGVILDNSSIEVHKANLSTVLDDEVTKGDGRNSIIPEKDVAEVVNGSGNKEIEESEREKGEATKTISVVEDSKIVKPQSFNITTEDEKIKKEVSVEKPVIEEDHTEAKHSPEQEEEIGNIPKVLIDTTPVKVDENNIEKSLNTAHEEIPIKTDEVKEEKDSTTVETSINGTEAEQNATVSVEEISRNGDNIVNETVPEDQTETNRESLHDIETTNRLLLEVEKEEEEAEPLYKTLVEDTNIVDNEETTAHEPKSLNGDNHHEENTEPIEAIRNLDDAEKISREVTVDKEKEEDIIQNTKEVQESHRVIEPTKDHEEEKDKISKETEEQENVLVRDIPQSETLVSEADTVDTSTVQEAGILKTNITEKEAVHSEIGGEEEGEETKENSKPSQDLEEDKEQEETETVKTIISSDEVRSSDVQAEVFGEHTKPSSSEIKDESHGREESIEVKSKETVPEKETATDGESLHEIETTKRVLLEAEKEEDREEIKTDEERRLNVIEKVETVTVKTVLDDPEIVNNEGTTVHESESSKENAEPVEAIKSSDDAEQTSREVTVNEAKEEEVTPNTEEIQVDPTVIETSKIQLEDFDTKASLEPKEEVDQSIKDTEEHEHVLRRDLPQSETFEAEVLETTEETKPSLDLKDDKETETTKTVISSDEVRSSAVQEEELGEHTEPCSSEINDESHGGEESVEVKSQEKHEDLLVVPSTESEKYQENEPETALVSNTEKQEKFEEIPSDFALNVDKEDIKDEKIYVDQVDGTQTMEEKRGLDSNGAEAGQIDLNRTDETEKLIALPNIESVEKMHKTSLESPSEVSEESSKTLDEKIEEEPEEVTLNQEGQMDGSYGLVTKEETVSVPKSSEPGEKAEEERSVIDMTPLQEESSQPNEQKEETKIEKYDSTNEEVKSDEVIKVSSASTSKELEGETVVEAEKIENKKEHEEEPAAEDNIHKSFETFETVEPLSSLPSSSEEQEYGTVSEKIEDEKVEEEPMVEIKSHERQEEVSEAVDKQSIDIEPSLTEKCSRYQNQPEEQVEEACSRDEQEKEISSNSEYIVNETYAFHSAEATEEETATNGESLHDVETTKRVLHEEKEEEEGEMKIDAELRLDAIEKKEIETAKTVVEENEIVKNEEATAHESDSLKGNDLQRENAESVEAIKDSDNAEPISSEVTGDIEKDEEIIQKAEEVQESPRVIEIPTIQGENNKSKASPELKEEVDQSSKDTEQHEHVLERDIPQCDTLEAEAVDTSTVQEDAILNTLETNISETEAVHSEIGGAEEGQETKEDTETSLELKVDKEQKEAETVKTVIFSDEVRSSYQVDVQAEESGKHTEPYTSEIKNESQGGGESVEITSKDIVQEESSEEKDVNLLDVRSGESEKYQENEPDTSLVSKTESVDKFEEIPSAVEEAGLDETTHKQSLVDVESVEKVQKPSLETPLELSEQTSKTVDEKIEDKPIEEVTLHQEGQDEGSNGLKTQEETISVPESRELGEQAQEAELCLPNEQETETKLQKERIEKHEPTKDKVSNDQQSLVEETSDEVIQVSSASLSEGPGDETVVEAEKIGEEQVADKIQKSIETVEIAEPHSSLPSSSEEQDHGIVSEKTDDEKVKDAEPTGDMSEKDLEISETTPLSLPSVDQKEDVKAFDEEIQIPSVALPLDEQEKVTSTEKGETKVNETEDDRPDEHVNSSTLPMFSDKNDNETLTAAAEKGDEEILLGTSNTSQNVCMQQEEFGKLEAPKLDDSKEDKSQEIAATIKEVEATSDQTLPIENSHTDNTPSSELVSEQDDHTPKQVEEIYEEEHKVEATGERNLPVETSQVYQTPSSDLVAALNDQTPTQVEETHEEETEEEHKLQAEEILPTQIIPRESSDETLASMLASKKDDQVTLQENNCVDDVRETKDTQEERPFSVETEESVADTKPKEPEDEMRNDHVETPTSPIISERNDNETPQLEEPKEEKRQEIPDTVEAIQATGDQILSIESSQEDQTLSSELVSELDDQTPRQVEKIHEEEANEKHKFEATRDQSLPGETSQEYQTLSSDLASGLDGQTPQQVEEVHVEETKEEHKLPVVVDQILPVETLQEDHTPSLVSEHEDQTSKQVEEILEEKTKETQEEIISTETVPRESFSEAPVSLLASEEEEPVTPQEGNCAGDTQEKLHFSVETEEKIGETKPKESEAGETKKLNDQVETPTKLTEVEDESTKKTDVEGAELTKDYPTEEAEHGDETYSTLPVVGILTELQTTLETERTINDSASSEGNVIKEPADQELKKGDAEVESNEKYFVSDIIEAKRLQEDESGEAEKIKEENGLAGTTLPTEEYNLQEEHKEEVKVQDYISREFEVNVAKKLQEETKEIAECKEEISADQPLTEVLPGEKILVQSSALPSEEQEHVISAEKQDVNALIPENISLQEEHPLGFEISKKEQKEETHETLKEEDQIVDIKVEKKDEEEQQKSSSEVKKDKEDVSELRVRNDFVSQDGEKEEVPHGVLENEEEINEVVTSEKQITDPVGVITKTSEAEQESYEEHVETQEISDDTKSTDYRDFPTEQAPKKQTEVVSADKSLIKEALGEQLQVPSSTVLDDFQENSNSEALANLVDRDLSVQAPSELIHSRQSPNQVEENSFEVKKAQEDKNKETVDALITNVQVQDQPKDFEAPAIQKEISEQEQKSNDLTHVQDDIGKNLTLEVRGDEIKGDGHDSVVAVNEETDLIEEKREVEHVKTELEDAIKHGVSVEEKNNMSEKIDREATKEINQEESKQTYTVKEETREEKKETNQECFSKVQKKDDAINKTTPEIGEIRSLSSVSKTQEKSEQKNEVSNQQKREIADEVPKIAEEVQQKDGESENSKDLFSEVKECEPASNEPARKSLSDLIQKVKGTDKIEDATTVPHMKEEPITEEEEDDGDHEHKDDKTSPDSIVMVEAKDTVSIIKTHKKSQGILSGVGSKVKHSISKVKKVLTGKSSHTTKPSSPK